MDGTAIYQMLGRFKDFRVCAFVLVQIHLLGKGVRIMEHFRVCAFVLVQIHLLGKSVRIMEPVEGSVAIPRGRPRSMGRSTEVWSLNYQK